MTDSEVEAVARAKGALLGSIKVIVVDTLPSDAWMLVSYRDNGDIEVARDKGHAIIKALDDARRKEPK